MDHFIHPIRQVSNNSGRRESVTNMMKVLGWESLEERNKSRVSVIFKIVNKLIAIPDTQLILNTAPTRGHRLKFHGIATRTNYHKTLQGTTRIASSPQPSHYGTP